MRYQQIHRQFPALTKEKNEFVCYELNRNEMNAAPKKQNTGGSEKNKDGWVLI